MKLKMREKETERRRKWGQAGRAKRRVGGERAGRKKEGFLEIHTTNPKGNDMNLRVWLGVNQKLSRNPPSCLLSSFSCQHFFTGSAIALTLRHSYK